MGNPFIDRINKRGNGEAGRKAEKHLAKRLTGKQQIGSGAIDIAEGDIQVDQFLIESKSTQKDSYAITLNTLGKISGEAQRADMVPAFALNFTTGNGRPRENGSWVMIREKDFKEYLAWIKTQGGD